MPVEIFSSLEIFSRSDHLSGFIKSEEDLPTQAVCPRTSRDTSILNGNSRSSCMETERVEVRQSPTQS